MSKFPNRMGRCVPGRVFCGCGLTLLLGWLLAGCEPAAISSNGSAQTAAPAADATSAPAADSAATNAPATDAASASTNAAASTATDTSTATPPTAPQASHGRVLDPRTLPAAKLVYQRHDGIYLRTLGQGGQRITAGAYPRFSHDGKYIAFVRGNTVMRRRLVDGAEQALAQAGNAHAVAYHPDGEHVYFTDGDVIKSVDVVNGTVTAVVGANDIREVDIDGSGERLVATANSDGWYVMAYDLTTGAKRKMGDGCSASISEDGSLVTNNQGGHTKMLVRDWTTGGSIGQIHAPDGGSFDNQFFSNDNDWITSLSEKDGNICLHYVPDDLYYIVTDEGGCDRADLFVTP